MGVPGVVPAAGEILQPHPGLVIDADVQLVLRGRIELLIVIGEPLGAVSVNDGVARPGKHVHAAWSKERQSVLPVGVIGQARAAEPSSRTSPSTGQTQVN